MESLAGYNAPIFTILIYLDIPTIEKCIRENINSSEYPFPHSLSSRVNEIVTSKYFINGLCERFNMQEVDSYHEFIKVWLKKRLFHRENELTVILQYYEKQFRLTKALKKAAKYSRFDFVDHILNEKRLWCSYRHIRAVSLGCCWSKKKVDSYLEYLYVKIFNESRYVESIERDISDHCKTRATIKKYESSGYAIEKDIFLDCIFVNQCWDVIRMNMEELKEDRISLPAACIDQCDDEIYRNQDLIPEDLRECVDITTIEEALYELSENPFSVKSLKLFHITPDMMQEDHPLFFVNDRIQNISDVEWLNDNGFEDNEERDFLDFILMYKNNKEIDSEDMPLFAIDYSPIDEECMHPERCTEFVIWCLENQLHKNTKFRDRVYTNLNYVFELLLSMDGFCDYNIDIDWYDPLSIQYFCENHLNKFSIFTGSKDELKKRLLNRVVGDAMMVEYVLAI